MDAACVGYLYISVENKLTYVATIWLCSNSLICGQILTCFHPYVWFNVNLDTK